MTSLVTRLLRGGGRRRSGDIAAHIGLRRLMNSPPPVANSQTLSLIGGLFYLAGGLVAVAAALTQLDTNQHSGLILLVGVVAILAGIVLVRFPDHVPMTVRRAMNFLGTSLILVVVLAAGSHAGGDALFWLFCFVPLDAFLFFAWKWALPMFGWLLGATAIATFGWHVITAREWFVVVVVVSVAAFAIGWLVQFAADGVWDPPTDMLNRRGFERDLDSRCMAADHTGRGFALATITLSGLDGRPAAEGRSRSDGIMSRLAVLWRYEAPAAATWARISDVEFAVLWDDSSGFGKYLDMVRSGAASTHPVSIGASDFRPGRAPGEMLAEATSGSVFSERRGGNRVTRAGLVNEHVEELRTAVGLGQLVPFYQPVVDLRSGCVVGAEALARWVHPQRGVIGPDDFIALAEQSGVIHALGHGILRRACADAASWHAGTTDIDRHRPLTIAVNVSGVQLRDEAFVGDVAQCLVEAGLPATSLTLEVTESTVAADDPMSRLALERLRLTGVSIAMDDFGTGYSNMARLANLPIDVLKVDQSFIRQLEEPGHARAVVQAILELARGIGLSTVVEGLEIAAHADFVAQCGAQQGQGWLFGHPITGTEFRARLLSAAKKADRSWAPRPWPPGSTSRLTGGGVASNSASTATGALKNGQW